MLGGRDSLKETDHFEDLGIDRKKVLKYALKT
jgi:hypothetical protein